MGPGVVLGVGDCCVHSHFEEVFVSPSVTSTELHHVHTLGDLSTRSHAVQTVDAMARFKKVRHDLCAHAAPCPQAS